MNEGIVSDPSILQVFREGVCLLKSLEKCYLIWFTLSEVNERGEFPGASVLAFSTIIMFIGQEIKKEILSG